MIYARRMGNRTQVRPFGGKALATLVVACALVMSGCLHKNPTGPFRSSEPGAPNAAPTIGVDGRPLGTGLLGDQEGAARVAFLAPLSGSSAEAGQALLNAAQIAAIEVAPQTFILQPYDTGGSAAGAQQAAQMALSQGARMIVGPLFSESVRAVAPVATQANVPVVAFSTDTGVSGGLVNVIGFAPAEQVRRMLEHAVRNNRTSLAVLAPNTPMGRATAEAARRVAQQVGMRIVGVESYESNGSGADQAVARLTRAGRFDTLLLADTGIGLSSVTSALPGAGVSPGSVMVLGTMLWDKEPRLANDSFLAGARFPAPDQAALEAFKTRYKATYGASPPDIAALGYDATALGAVLARGGPQSFTINNVRNPQGFVGVGGLFRFRSDGTVERGMAIREVRPGGAVQIEPAPRSFTGAVY